MSQTRQPEGSPKGGQFAPGQRPEADVELDSVATGGFPAAAASREQAYVPGHLRRLVAARAEMEAACAAYSSSPGRTVDRSATMLLREDYSKAIDICESEERYAVGDERDMGDGQRVLDLPGALGLAPITARVVMPGDGYGLDECLVHDSDKPMIEFHDRRYAHGRFGQFTGGRYYFADLADNGRMDWAANGLDLAGGVPAWKVPAEQKVAAVRWAHAEVERRRATSADPTTSRDASQPTEEQAR